MKKLVLLLLLSLCLLTGCRDDRVMLNGFDSIQALYTIRPAIQLMDGAVDIVTKDSGPVHSGTGSARLTYEKGSKPYLVLHLEQAAPGLDLSTMQVMELSVFNDNPQSIPCEISLVGTDFAPVLTQDYVLAPGQWNTLTLPLTPGSFPSDEVLGFGLLIDAEENTCYYLDSWTLTRLPLGDY